MVSERAPAGALVIALWREGDPGEGQVKARLSGRYDAERASVPEECVVCGTDEIVGLVEWWIALYLESLDR